MLRTLVCNLRGERGGGEEKRRNERGGEGGGLD